MRPTLSLGALVVAQQGTCMRVLIASRRRYCGLAPQALVFERGPAGKPELCRAAHPPAQLPGGRRLRFNLSHTPSLLGACLRPVPREQRGPLMGFCAGIAALNVQCTATRACPCFGCAVLLHAPLLPGAQRSRCALHRGCATSRTAGWTGCAVAVDAGVGLDVEEAARVTRGDPLRLARRRFSPAEAASLAGPQCYAALGLSAAQLQKAS